MKTLPAGAFDEALNRYQAAQVERVRLLHNRSRAVFAEFLVAEILDAALPPDPGWPWDITWTHGGREIRIQVKCSGDRTMRGGDRPAPIKWDVKVPSAAWDEDAGISRRIDSHQCDVFVLARHSGRDISNGWTFYVLPASGAPVGAINPKKLAALGIEEIAAADLAGAVAAAAR